MLRSLGAKGESNWQKIDKNNDSALGAKGESNWQNPLDPITFQMPQGGSLAKGIKPFFVQALGAKANPSAHLVEFRLPGNALAKGYPSDFFKVVCAHSGDDDMISLTGIHKASGEGEHKAPGRWMALGSTKDFLSAFNDMSRTSEMQRSTESPADRAKESGLVKIFRGVHHGGLVTVGASQRFHMYSQSHS